MKNQLYALLPFLLLTLVHTRTNAQWTVYDTISFETPETAIIIDTAGGNIWQIGSPQKTFFDTAHSPTHAILTDTALAYPASDTSSFIYVIREPYTQTCQTCMEFWHKYDMGSAGDQGSIDASYDAGDSWVPVEDSFYVLPMGSTFFWNPDYHANTGNYTSHPLITSGTSDGWIKSGFCWQWFLPVNPDTIISNPDSLLIRFTFIADSIVEDSEGWMIDDIVTSSAGLELCSSTVNLYSNDHITVHPNPFSSETSIQSDYAFKNATLTIYNSLGSPVKQLQHISGESILLNREYLPAGLYFLQLAQHNTILKAIKLVVTDH